MKRTAAVAALVVLTAAACGPDPEPGSTAPAESTESSASTETTAPLETTTSVEASGPAESTESSASTGTVGGPTGLEVERGAPAGELQTEPVAGVVKLWVSNQSFADDPVELVISIDGTELIAEAFEVQGQHNWISFFVRGLEPGSHELTAVSATGVEYESVFTVMTDQPRWLVLDYWYYPEDVEGRMFTFGEFDHPVGFD